MEPGGAAACAASIEQLINSQQVTKCLTHPCHGRRRPDIEIFSVASKKVVGGRAKSGHDTGGAGRSIFSLSAIREFIGH